MDGIVQHFCRIRNGLQRLLHALHYVSLGIAGAIVDLHGHIGKTLQGINRINTGGGMGLHIAAPAAAAATSVSVEKPVDSHDSHRLLDCRF